METRCRISTSWNEPRAAQEHATGVSLHSHTSFSEETLSFIQVMGMRFPGVGRIQRHYEQLCRERYGLELDFVRANWRPPLQPRMAWEAESRQIARMGLYPLVSITDHDTMEGAMLLRTLKSSRHIPMSAEWSVPWGQTEFHLGIHNLPSGQAVEWMRRFRDYTSAPSDDRLLQMLRELHESPQVLIVLNHPLWDLHTVGDCLHTSEVLRFLNKAKSCVHALELNGLRHAQENRETARLARDRGYLLISGGDRHGLEPNANINLTGAATFTEFVEEIRVERRSHIHFMPQYRSRWEQRIVQSTLAAVTDYPQFLEGWRRWDDRVFHPDVKGEMRPLSQLWVNGRPPAAVMATIHLTRLFGKRGVAAPLRLAFPRVNDLGVGMEWV
jgi:hypothetical protein